MIYKVLYIPGGCLGFLPSTVQEHQCFFQEKESTVDITCLTPTSYRHLPHPSKNRKKCVPPNSTVPPQSEKKNSGKLKPMVNKKHQKQILMEKKTSKESQNLVKQASPESDLQFWRSQKNSWHPLKLPESAPPPSQNCSIRLVPNPEGFGSQGTRGPGSTGFLFLHLWKKMGEANWHFRNLINIKGKTRSF